jgi:hypothetical protein
MMLQGDSCLHLFRDIHRRPEELPERPGLVHNGMTHRVLEPDGAVRQQTDRAVKVLVSTLLNSGLESLTSRFGSAP